MSPIFEIERLNEHFALEGIQHFTGYETLQLLRLSETAPIPPEYMWPGMVHTLSLAEAIRNEYGSSLVIANGYRPRELNDRVGGARNSQHIQYRALDLQLPRNAISDRDSQEQLYRAAAVVFLRYPKMAIGLGVYRRHRGPRVHIDVGFRRRVWGGKRKAWVRELLDENR